MGSVVEPSGGGAEPDAAVELLLIFAKAFVMASPPKQAVEFLSNLAEALCEHDDGEVILFSRRAAGRVRARNRAFDDLRAALPGLVASLPASVDT